MPATVMPETSSEARASETSASAVHQSDVLVRAADFAELQPPGKVTADNGIAPLDRLFDVHVTATAELGRKTLTIAEVLKLSVGSVVELDRPTTEPVDLMVQGVRLARGEVMVVNDCFAILVTEITDPKKRTTK